MEPSDPGGFPFDVGLDLDAADLFAADTLQPDMLSWLLLNADDIASGANPPAISPMQPPTGFSPPQTHHQPPYMQSRPQQPQREFAQHDGMQFHSQDVFPQQHLMGYVPIYQNPGASQFPAQRQLPSPASSSSASLLPQPTLIKTESAVSTGSYDDPGSEAVDFGDLDGESSVADGPNQASKRKKLQKNRDSAREIRKKQRVRAEELQDRVNELKAENEQLHAHLSKVQQRTLGLSKQKEQMEAQIHSRVTQEDSSDEELFELIKKFTELYADYGKNRRAEVNFHLQQLEKLLLPTTTTKMCLWTLEQDHDFFDANDNSSLFSILSNELNISSDQIKRIQARKQRIRDLSSNLRESLSLLGEVKKLVESKQRNFDRKIGALQAILTPRQVGKFVTWVTRNQNKLAQVIPSFHIPDIFSLGVGNGGNPGTASSSSSTPDAAGAGSVVASSTGAAAPSTRSTAAAAAKSETTVKLR